MRAPRHLANPCNYQSVLCRAVRASVHALEPLFRICPALFLPLGTRPRHWNTPLCRPPSAHASAEEEIVAAVHACTRGSAIQDEVLRYKSESWLKRITATAYDLRIILSCHAPSTVLVARASSGLIKAFSWRPHSSHALHTFRCVSSARAEPRSSNAGTGPRATGPALLRRHAQWRFVRRACSPWVGECRAALN